MGKSTPVRVIGAPGYVDFTGELAYEFDTGQAAGKSIVGFTCEGTYELAIVPSSCVHPITDAMLLADLRKMFERQWYCHVVASGLHNGATCSPDDPHDGWKTSCSYRWIAPALTDQEARELGLTDNEEGTKET